jgi:hypothetical protein
MCRDTARLGGTSLTCPSNKSLCSAALSLVAKRLQRTEGRTTRPKDLPALSGAAADSRMESQPTSVPDQQNMQHHLESARGQRQRSTSTYIHRHRHRQHEKKSTNRRSRLEHCKTANQRNGSRDQTLPLCLSWKDLHRRATRRGARLSRGCVPIARRLCHRCTNANGFHALHVACVRAHGWHVAGAGEVAQGDTGRGQEAIGKNNEWAIM